MCQIFWATPVALPSAISNGLGQAGFFRREKRSERSGYRRYDERSFDEVVRYADSTRVNNRIAAICWRLTAVAPR